MANFLSTKGFADLKMANYNTQLQQVGAQAALLNNERNLDNAPDKENN